MTTTDRSSHGDAPQSHLMIVAGPQGIGKTYLANGLRERGTEFVIAPGVVTRPARGDQDGNDIQVTAEQFQRMSDKGELCLEAVVGQERYGYLQEGIVDRKSVV
jgi:Guanylate kinase